MIFIFESELEIYRNDICLYTINKEYSAWGNNWQEARELLEHDLNTSLSALGLSMYIEHLEPIQG